MIENPKRGGITFVGAKRYAKASNNDMGELNYDSTKPSSYIAYVDANNLYGWAMVQPLPYKDIEFEEINRPTLETSPTSDAINPATSQTVSEETCPATLRTNSETLLSSILETPDDSETGYYCEVDFESPTETHALLKQMPPCPETLKPDVDWLSDHQRAVMEKTQANTTSEKLIPHLMKHENYFYIIEFEKLFTT